MWNKFDRLSPPLQCLIFYCSLHFRVEIGVDTKQQTMTSLAFPFDREALVALESYAKNGHDYLQFSIGKHEAADDDVIGL
jgi:hypothetical protein